MKTFKTLLITVLALSIFSSAHAATEMPCPAPNQIVNLQPGGLVSEWIAYSASGGLWEGGGMGSPASASLIGPGYIGLTQACFYASSSEHVSPAELAKNINQIPEQVRPYLKYLQDPNAGVLILVSSAANK